MPGDDMFKIAFSILIAGIVVYKLAGMPGFLPKVEISFIAGLGTLLLIFGFFSIYSKTRQE